MSALPPKADIQRVVAECPVMTHNGHPHERAAVLRNLAACRSYPIKLIATWPVITRPPYQS